MSGREAVVPNNESKRGRRPPEPQPTFADGVDERARGQVENVDLAIPGRRRQALAFRALRKVGEEV